MAMNKKKYAKCNHVNILAFNELSTISIWELSLRITVRRRKVTYATECKLFIFSIFPWMYSIAAGD